MPCQTLILPDGSAAIICGARARRRYCKCGRTATRQCDHPVTGKRSKTCSAWICERCAVRVGPDIDLCPPHAALARSSAQQGLDPSLFREAL